VPIDPNTRKTLGAWYTPAPLIDHVLDVVLTPVLAARPSPDGLRILDPACGDGRFLVAAADRIRRRYGTVPPGCLLGIDVDETAASAAGAALGPAGDIEVGDALTGVHGPPVDVVVGNPPYLNQLARNTSRRRRSPLGGGAYADTAALFLALALQAVRPDGGRVGLVLPQSILSTRDTASIRAGVLAHAIMDSLWWAGADVFDAAVHVCVPTFVRGGSPGPIARWLGPAFSPLPAADGSDLPGRPTWGHLVADAVGIPLVDIEGSGVLGSIATATADFRDQYYGLVPFVADDGTGPPLITSGLIDPGRSHWGLRRARFARRHFHAPRVDVDALPDGLAAWAAARLVPKVLVATQTPVLEALVDEQGDWLPSVPVITVVPKYEQDLWRVAAVLTAPAVSAWAAATFLGAGMSGSSIKLAASQVRTIPLPAARSPWEGAAAVLASGDVDGCARLMDRAYRTDVYGWWRNRQSGTRRAHSSIETRQSTRRSRTIAAS
jgi:hypothetical protein